MSFAEALLLSVVTAAMPLMLAALGEMVVERSGVLNLGVEGMMVMGAVAAFGVAVATGSATLGIIAGIGAGIAMAALLFLGKRQFVDRVATAGPGRLIGQLWLNAWGFDWLYDRLFVKPYVWLAHLHRNDPVDTRLVRVAHGLLDIADDITEGDVNHRQVVEGAHDHPQVGVRQVRRFGRKAVHEVERQPARRQ